MVKHLFSIFPHVYCFLSECITTEGSTDGVPDRKRYGSMKLLQFHENYRPAYWGTWSKKSSHISPRCPLRQDKVRPFCINLFSLLDTSLVRDPNGSKHYLIFLMTDELDFICMCLNVTDVCINLKFTLKDFFILD